MLRRILEYILRRILRWLLIFINLLISYKDILNVERENYLSD